MSSHDPKDFLSRYDFSRGPGGAVGLEDERCVVSEHGVLVPRAHEILSALDDPVHYSCELTNCQVEHNTAPYRTLDGVVQDLCDRRMQAQAAAQGLGLRLVSIPAAPADMPQDICPTSARYANMAEVLRGRGVLLPALRVSSLQVNLSGACWCSLLEMYNRLVESLPCIMDIGDRSGGVRMTLYRQVVDGFGFDPTPRVFESPKDMCRLACDMGWADNPNGYHPHIRIKPSTATAPPLIEVRPIDAIESVETIREVVAEVLRIAGKADF